MQISLVSFLRNNMGDREIAYVIQTDSDWGRGLDTLNQS